jgi:hypothetical protein
MTQAAISFAVQRAFGSDPSNPHFDFVGETAETEPYSSVISQIEVLAKVTDITDLNYEVSFGYAIEDHADVIVLRLSMVGPFATMFRVVNGALPEAAPWEFLPPGNEARSVVERGLRDIIHGEGFRFLDQYALEQLVRLRIDDDACVAVYRALFDTLEGLPWQ